MVEKQETYDKNRTTFTSKNLGDWSPQFLDIYTLLLKEDVTLQ